MHLTILLVVLQHFSSNKSFRALKGVSDSYIECLHTLTIKASKSFKPTVFLSKRPPRGPADSGMERFGGGRGRDVTHSHSHVIRPVTENEFSLVSYVPRNPCVA